MTEEPRKEVGFCFLFGGPGSVREIRSIVLTANIDNLSSGGFVLVFLRETEIDFAFEKVDKIVN